MGGRNAASRRRTRRLDRVPAQEGAAIVDRTAGVIKRRAAAVMRRALVQLHLPAGGHERDGRDDDVSRILFRGDRRDGARGRHASPGEKVPTLRYAHALQCSR